ncbi:MAG TPA: hypothetical protein VIB38_13335 [Aestuariivirgaceae bacterium]|jgi:hypothetical protein
METVARKTNEEIAREILQILARNFENIRVIEIRISDEQSSETDDGKLLPVTVVFEGTPKKADYRTFSGATRLTRSKLDESGVTAFPIFSFVTKEDFGARETS